MCWSMSLESRRTTSESIRTEYMPITATSAARVYANKRISVIGCTMTCLHCFIRDEGGATAIEYALIAGFVAVIIVGAVRSVGLSLVPKFTGVSTGLS